MATPGDRQQQLDFNRGAQLRILERAIIPGDFFGRGGKESANTAGNSKRGPQTHSANIKNRGTLKNILKALDTYQRTHTSCHPSIRTLALNTGLSGNSIRRGLHRLAELGLIAITPNRRRDGSYTSHTYEIDWLALLNLAPPTLDAERPNDPFSSGGGTPNMGGGTPKLGGGYSQVGSSHHKRPSKRPSKREAYGDAFSKDESDRTSEPQSRSPSAALPTAALPTAALPTAALSSGALSSGALSSGALSSGSLPLSARSYWGRTRPLTTGDLLEDASVNALYEFARAREWLSASELDRIRFFSLCRYVAAKAAEPGKLLTTLCKRLAAGRAVEGIRQADEDAARLSIARLRLAAHGVAPAAIPAAAALALEADVCGDARRLEISERLRAKLKRKG